MPEKRKWLCVLFRDPSEWRVIGQMDWYKTDISKPFAPRRKMGYRQKSYVSPDPEDVSPFVQSHRIVEAETQEEALRLCQT